MPREGSMAKKIYVGNLNFDTTDDGLRELFAPHGTVVSADVVMDRYSGRSRGFGFVEMEDEAGAEAAVAALDGQEFQGRNLRVDIAKSQP